MIRINGEQHDCLSVQDRGLHYGDGLFETVAVVDGQPRLWDWHMARLHRGCQRLKIVPPDRGACLQDIQALAGQDRCVIKLIVTRGPGQRGYRLPEKVAPNRIVIRSEWPSIPESHREQGIRMRLCETRLGQQPLLAGLKHLNRLEQVMARAEWDDPDIVEGLMLDAEDHLIEGTMSNLFLVRAGGLYTPVLDQCGVEGVQRQHLIRQAEQAGLTVNICRIPYLELGRYDEAFVCNALIGIWPVRQIEQQDFSIGPVTRRCQEMIAT